jgi:rod shape determining protein RodA
MGHHWWKKIDWYLAVAGAVLLGMGLTMLASSTLGTDLPYLRNQVLFSVIGIVASGSVIILGHEWFIRWSIWLYAAIVTLLIILAGFGRITRGASSWFDIGPFSLQPSEFAKVILLLLIAWLVHKAVTNHWSRRRLFLWMGIALLPLLVLVAVQPDLGTASVLLAGWLMCAWLSPISRKALVGLGAGLLVAAVGLWLLMAPYQRERLVTFIDPAASPLGAGYNVLQSQIAVGSGGLLGRGWGRGTQSHLNFLPEHHTDFIFASLSEEFGFAGAFVMVVLFGVVVWRVLWLMWHSEDVAHVVLAGGILATLFFQATINMAMNIGLAPVTGVPLPLVSYGGSSLLTTCLMIGLLQSMYAHASTRRHPGW